MSPWPVREGKATLPRVGSESWLHWETQMRLPPRHHWNKIAGRVRKKVGEALGFRSHCVCLRALGCTGRGADSSQLPTHTFLSLFWIETFHSQDRCGPWPSAKRGEMGRARRGLGKAKVGGRLAGPSDKRHIREETTEPESLWQMPTSP